MPSRVVPRRGIARELGGPQLEDVAVGVHGFGVVLLARVARGPGGRHLPEAYCELL